MVEAAIVHEFTLALERIETSRKERGKQIRSIPVYSGAFRSIPVYSRPFPSQGSCSRPGRSRRNSKVNDDLEWVSGDEVEQDDLKPGEVPADLRMVGVKVLRATFGVDEKTIQKWIQSEGLPVIRIGGIVRFRVADVEDFIARHTEQADPATIHQLR